MKKACSILLILMLVICYTMPFGAFSDLPLIGAATTATAATAATATTAAATAAERHENRRQQEGFHRDEGRQVCCPDEEKAKFREPQW